MTDAELTASLQVAASVAAAVATAADPKVALAAQLVTQGIQFWSDFQAKKAAGTLTMDDLDVAAAKTGVDLAQLAVHVNALPK